MRIQMLAVDVDGTLLDDNLVLRERSKRALQEAARRGVRVVLCSARTPDSLQMIAREFGGVDPLVSINGSLVVQSNGEIIRFKPMTRQEMETAVRICRTMDFHYEVNDLRQVYVEKILDWMVPFYQHYNYEPVEVADLLAVPGVRPLRIQAAGQVNDIHPKLSSALPHLEVSKNGTDYIDVRRRDVSKGEAAAWLAGRWNIPPSRVMAIGNYYNDVPLLRWAGTGVAVSNAPEEVQMQAEKVVADNNSDGVAEAVERFVLPDTGQEQEKAV